MTEDEDDWRRAQGDRREHPDDAEHPRDELTEVELRVQRLEALLVQKGVVRPAVLDELIDMFETRVGPRNGAKVIARAWADPAFKHRLVENATEAIAEMGFVDRQGGDIVVLENSATVHNLVVCTLCSCYPWPVLGLPPVWYKSAPYRSRAVIDPRGVLREFGVDLPDDIEVRVWDSTAEIRYLVLPERPSGTEGMTAEELAEIVTRDAMIGTARVNAPESASNGPKSVVPEDRGR
jgi:nitrile hydratase